MSDKVRVITQVVFVKTPTTVLDVVPYLLVFTVYGLIVQAVFSVWKKLHEKSYNIFVLIAILTALPAISYFFSSYLSFLAYIIFLGYTSYLVYTAFNFSSKRDGIKTVFRAFKIIFAITNHTTVVLQFTLVIFFFFGIDKMLPILKFLFYSTYFAVLSREIVKNICLVMVRTTGLHSKEGVPGRKDSTTNCMICTLPLVSENEKVLTTQCGHTYHENCIKGWTLVGQNTQCYYCKEPIDNKIFDQNYWIKSELFIKPMMNTMRSLIAFSAVIVGLLYFRLRGSDDYD